MKYASEALVYIGKYGIEKEMRKAGLNAGATRKRHQDESLAATSLTADITSTTTE